QLLRPTPTPTPFPYTPLFRSPDVHAAVHTPASDTLAIRGQSDGVKTSVPGREVAHLLAGLQRPAAQQRAVAARDHVLPVIAGGEDRKSTRLNSSHLGISYAVF